MPVECYQHDEYRCSRCQALFRARRPDYIQWEPAPGPCPHTGKWDKERGHNRGHSMVPPCPHCGSRYFRRLS